MIISMLSGIGFLGFFAPPIRIFLIPSACDETVEQTKTNPTGPGQLVPKPAPVSAGLEALVSQPVSWVIPRLRNLSATQLQEHTDGL